MFDLQADNDEKLLDWMQRQDRHLALHRELDGTWSVWDMATEETMAMDETIAGAIAGARRWKPPEDLPESVARELALSKPQADLTAVPGADLMAERDQLIKVISDAQRRLYEISCEDERRTRSTHVHPLRP